VSEKKTGFDKASGAEVPEIMDDGEHEARSNVPRAVFTKDQTLDLSKLTIAQLRLAQGTTPEVTERKASIGQFVLTNFPAYDSVILVPFGAPDIRKYQPDPKKPPLCHAPTGDFGFGNPGGECAICPLSQWGDYNEATQKSTPPPCKEGILVRAYSVTHRCLVDFQFLAGERSKGGFIQQQSMSFGWSNFAFKMTSTSKSNNRGAWYVPMIEMLDEVPPEQLEIVNKWYEVFLASQSNSKEEALLHLKAVN